MAIEVNRPTLTREEFKALQDPADGDVRGFEYFDGEFMPVPSVHGPQSKAWGDLFGKLYHHVETYALGELFLDMVVYLDPEDRRRAFPDDVFLASADAHRYDGEVIVGAPTLVVEVSAETSRER